CPAWSISGKFEVFRRFARGFSPRFHLRFCLFAPIEAPFHTRGSALPLPFSQGKHRVGRSGAVPSKARSLPAEVQPEKENGCHGTPRFFYASAAGSWCSLWSPDPPLEPEDGEVPLRRS